MIDAVMYGYTPSAAMLTRRSAPPLNRLKKPSSRFVSNALSSWRGSTPGIGMWATNRNTTSIAAVKSSFFRMSGCCTASKTA